jgi:hypothetical protein
VALINKQVIADCKEFLDSLPDFSGDRICYILSDILRGRNCQQTYAKRVEAFDSLTDRFNLDKKYNPQHDADRSLKANITDLIYTLTKDNSPEKNSQSIIKLLKASEKLGIKPQDIVSPKNQKDNYIEDLNSLCQKLSIKEADKFVTALEKLGFRIKRVNNDFSSSIKNPVIMIEENKR